MVKTTCVCECVCISSAEKPPGLSYHSHIAFLPSGSTPRQAGAQKRLLKDVFSKLRGVTAAVFAATSRYREKNKPTRSLQGHTHDSIKETHVYKTDHKTALQVENVFWKKLYPVIRIVLLWASESHSNTFDICNATAILQIHRLEFIIAFYSLLTPFVIMTVLI